MFYVRQGNIFHGFCPWDLVRRKQVSSKAKRTVVTWQWFPELAKNKPGLNERKGV